MSALAHWTQASRPVLHWMVAPPLLVGQLLAWRVSGRFSAKTLLVVELFGVLAQLFAVLANDAVDWRADAQNRTFNRFSGGSRVVAEGKLTPRQLFFASLGAALAMGAVSAYHSLTALQPYGLLLSAAVVPLVWAHSFRPLALAWRGHGELVQALLLGVLLPVYGFYAQSGDLGRYPWRTLLPLSLLAFAGSVLTGLADTSADRRAGKRSFSVRHGELAARRTALAVIVAATLAAPFTGPVAPASSGGALFALPLALLALPATRLAAADSSEHAECQRFVAWGAAAIVASQLCLAAAGWLGR